MPGGDGTGPLGMGPMSGRGAGFCGGFGAPGYASPVMGRGRGGRGRGLGRMFWAAGAPVWARLGWGALSYAFGSPTPEVERETLKQQMGAMEAQLDAIKRRLEELQGSQTKED